MKLNIHIILEELHFLFPEHNLEETLLADDKGMIGRKQVLTKAESHLDENVLYILEEKLFLEFPEEVVKNHYFAVCGNHFFPEEIYGRAFVICVDDRYTVTELSNALDVIFYKYEEWDQKLNDCIFNRANINDFLDICVPVLPNPFYILDSLNTLVYVGGKIPENISDTIFQYILPSSYFDFEDVEVGSINYGEEKYQNLKNAYWAQKDTTYYSFIAYNLFPNRIRYGEIVTVDTSSPLTSGQLYLIEYLGKKLTILLENIQYKLYAYSPENYILLEMLEGKNISSANLKRYLNKLGWKRDDKYYVFCFSAKGEDRNDESYLKIAVPRIKKVLPYSVMVFFHEILVCIVWDNQSMQVNEILKKVLAKYLKKLDIQCGVSIPFYDFTNFKLYYEQARLALQVGIGKGSYSRVLTFDEEYLVCILSAIEQITDLNMLYDSRVITLIEYGKEKGVDLFGTLYCYLSNRKSITKTAEILFIHKNTVLQRLERIENISGIRMDGTEHEDYLLFSCEVVQYLMSRQDKL